MNNFVQIVVRTFNDTPIPIHSSDSRTLNDHNSEQPPKGLVFHLHNPLENNTQLDYERRHLDMGRIS